MRPESRHKAQRLNLIVTLLWKRPNGLTSRELAQELGVTTRTIQRDLLDLQDDAYRTPLIRSGDRWALLAEGRPLLSSLRLTLSEATALALAARLLQRASDEVNPHVNAALAKLTDILPESLAQHLQALLTIGAAAPIPGFASTFEMMAASWARRRTVRVVYQPAKSLQMLETDFDVYCLEPIAPSFAIYAIGYAHARHQVRTLKLERVTRATLTDQTFIGQPDFDVRAFLLSGWGIMGGSDLQTVRLRFAPEAVRRLRESQFHGSQQVVDLSDGSCILTFQIAHLIEVIPFIRGWGPLVEVLEPEPLRQLVALDARRTADIYAHRRSPSPAFDNC